MVVVSGEIDVMSAAGLRRALLQALETTVGRLVVDLSAVQFMDATGIGTLVDAANKAAESGRSLVIARPSGVVRRMIQILGPDWPLQTV